MKKFEMNPGRQEKSESTKLFNFTNENKMEVLGQYQMKKIKGGLDEGEDDMINQEWED